MDKLVVWKEREGRPYLSIDLRGASREGQLQAMEAYARALENKPEASVVVLVLASELEFHPEVMTKGRAVMLQQQGKVRRSALVNMGGILKVAFEGYYEVAKLLGMSMDEHGRHFNSEDEALAWLLQA